MKILPINSYSDSKNLSCRGANKTCKYGITALIASTTLFMASNAIDSFEQQEPKTEKTTLKYMDTAASVLGILGTGLSILGIKQPDYGSNFRHL